MLIIPIQGQCFIAIDPDAFAPGFAERMQDFMGTMRSLPQVWSLGATVSFNEILDQASGQEPVEVAGDMERRHVELCSKLGGIPYHPNQISFAVSLLNNQCLRAN